MRGIAIAAVLASSCLTNSVAQAYFNNGNDIAEYHADFKKAVSGARSADYANARVFQAHVIATYDALQLAGAICPPENVHGRQVYSIVSNYFDNNPALWSGPSFFIINDALNEAFPCG